MNFKFHISNFGKILLLFWVCFGMIPIGVKAATLYLMPQSQSVYQGDSFVVEVRLNTEDEEINTAMISLEVTDFLEVVDFSEGDSILTLWPKKAALQENEISLTGGTPQGFSGDGLILRITFKAKILEQQETKKAEISFKEDSKILLNDGKGTEANLVFLGGNYEIIKKSDSLPQISSRTHPDQDKWSNNPNFHLHWDLVEGAEYSYLLSRDPLATSDEMPNKPEGELLWLGDMKYENLEDGIYYFHLREKREAEQKWGNKVSFRGMIDTQPPEEFKPKIGQDPSLFEEKYFLSFATKDSGSGIDHYEILEARDGGEEVWKIEESPYLLENQTLQSIIRVKAIDKAGNERIAEIVPSLPEKLISLPGWKIILVLAGIGIVWWILRIIREKRIQKRHKTE